MLLMSTYMVRRFPAACSLLRQVVRSAWLDLLEDPQDLQQAVIYVFEKRHYVACLKRLLGVGSLLFDLDRQS